MSPPQSRSASSRIRWANVVIIALTAFAAFFGAAMSGRASPSGLSLMLGRLHPLAVHLPIGMIVLVGGLELAACSSRYRSRIDPAMGLVLRASFASALASFVLGLLLAREGGYPVHALTLHRKLAFGTLLGTACAAIAWSYVERGSSRSVFRAALVATTLVLTCGAHFGGVLTHGETYLTDYAPLFVRRAFGLAPRDVAKVEPNPPTNAEPLMFDAVVLPILRDKCASCHGPDKAKGGLRLDTFEGLAKGGKHGSIVAGADAGQNLVVERLALPLDADEHMPPQDEPQLTAAELEVLTLWFERGADPALRVRDVLVPAGASDLLAKAKAQSAGVDAGAARQEPGEVHGADAEAAQPGDDGGAEDGGARGARDAGDVLDASATAPKVAPAKAVRSDMNVYDAQISPLLAKHCGRCHGPAKQKGKLRTDSLAALLAGGKSGPAIVPFQPSRSELVMRMRVPLEDDEHMPPAEEPQLNAGEVRLIESWISSGARGGASAKKPSATE